jgi:hypothetical protein
MIIFSGEGSLILGTGGGTAEHPVSSVNNNNDNNHFILNGAFSCGIEINEE